MATLILAVASTSILITLLITVPSLIWLFTRPATELKVPRKIEACPECGKDISIIGTLDKKSNTIKNEKKCGFIKN